jgi:hypothetical protein
LAIVAVEAEEEAHIAENPPQATIVAMPSPPRKRPSQRRAASNISSARPALTMNTPIRMNSGSTEN